MRFKFSLKLKYENAFDPEFRNYDEDEKMKILINCLGKLNRDYALTRCCQINYELFKNSDGIDKKLIDANFSPDSIKAINKFVEKQKYWSIYDAYYEQKNYVAFWRSQITRMMFYILQHCTND